MRVFTIKEGIPTTIYGFESSQLARQSIMQELGIEHQFVITKDGPVILTSQGEEGTY